MKPTRAIVWENGMLMVFNEHGHQVPKYQGESKDKLPKLLKDFPRCPIERLKWRA